MKQALMDFWQDEEGAAMLEYGIIIALIAAVVIANIQTIGATLNTIFGNISSSLSAGAAGSGGS